MMTHPLPVSGKMPLKTMVGRQVPYACTYTHILYIMLHDWVQFELHVPGGCRGTSTLVVVVAVSPSTSVTVSTVTWYERPSDMAAVR